MKSRILKKGKTHKWRGHSVSVYRMNGVMNWQRKSCRIMSGVILHHRVCVVILQSMTARTKRRTSVISTVISCLPCVRLRKRGNGEISSILYTNKIRKKNGKGYEGHSEPTTDWNSKEKATEWRKDLADTINAVNERTGNTENLWEHRSFKERGLDIIPEVHLGAKACALENRGVRTERGDINRKIRLLNSAVRYAKDNYLSAKTVLDDMLAKPAEVVRKAKTEITELLDRVQARMGRLALPVASGKYLAKIPNRERAQNIENALSFLERRQIETFEQLQEFRSKKGADFDGKEEVFLSKWQRLEQLKELAKAYAEYEPYKKIHDESKSLSGLKKIRYDKEHERELVQYDMTRAELKSLLSEGEKITPKAWRTEKEQLEKEMPELRGERARACHDLAVSEVISYNKTNLERLEQNEHRRGQRQPDHEQTTQKKRKNEQEL